jgi:hypothetical protein
MGNSRVAEHFLRVVDGLASSFGFATSDIDADNLLAKALRRTRRSGFRDTSFVPALRLLLSCYQEEAGLSVFGQKAAKWDVLRGLSNILRFEAEEERDENILREPIEKPVFITGLPRSGTTLLHELLATDPQLRAPRCWETITPYADGDSEARRRSFDRQLRLFQRLAPEMADMHPMSAVAPQECTEITAQVFQSVRYEATHRIPSYQKWLDATGHIPAYRFHKRFLQHLQRQQKGGGRWVLKCPDHIHALDAIETVYPDCRFVFVHRDPLRVIASASKLTEVLRRPFTRRIDKAEIGSQVAGRVIEAADAMIAKTETSPSDRILHLHYVDFAHNPVASVEKLYTQLGLELKPEARWRMGAHLSSAQNISHSYSFEEFGLDPEGLRHRLKPYMDAFGVHRESEIWKTPTNVPIAA